ncbi:indole-3-glycerol phosphate synthase TrpC [Candidatus Margulisiibacteriota bacterium]
MILDDIVQSKYKEIASIKQHLGLGKIAEVLKELPNTRDFTSAIKKKKMTLIAEAKKASPSAGIIVDDYHPEKIAIEYSDAGVSAISVLTEQKNFMGFVTDLKKVKEHVNLPILRKDFIVDETQLYHTRLSFADAVLLIVRILDKKKLKKFIKLSEELLLHSLVEVHTPDEAKMALDAGAEMIGINNRDLDTLEVDIRNTEKIIKKVPALKKKVLVSESGIKTGKDVKFLAELGVNSILVGEALLKSGDIKAKVKELLGAS